MNNASAMARRGGLKDDRDIRLMVSSSSSSSYALAYALADDVVAHVHGDNQDQITQDTNFNTMKLDGTSDIRAEALGDGNTVPCIPEAIVEEELNEHVPGKVKSTLIVSEIGMSFESDKQAYDMYNHYASKVGFSIRRSLE
ncbi:hypothetical protein BS78_09G192900 [Paspalum vaginatum]|nr:hypothetical protein BS78_09G192900 [Paspalum vaginatum]